MDSAQKKLTFESAVDFATAFEAVELQTHDIKKHGPVTTEGVKDIENNYWQYPKTVFIVVEVGMHP